jgi:hypothetical protein
VTAGAILVAGKAMLWFAIPLVLAICELRSVSRSKDPGASDA